MEDRARILLADHEEVFCQATAEWLRHEGYEVECAPDLETARRLARRGRHETIVIEPGLPGDGLSLVRSLAESGTPIPAVVVTAEADLDSALACYDLPVVAYLCKPVDYTRLLEATRAGVRRHRLLGKTLSARERLAAWQTDIAALADQVRSARAGDSSGIASQYLLLNLYNTVANLLELRDVAELLSGESRPEAAAAVVAGGTRSGLLETIREAVAVLEKTKSAFKSKDLGQLRRRLEHALIAHQVISAGKTASGDRVAG